MSDIDDLTDDAAPSGYDQWRDENSDALEANDKLTAEREEASKEQEQTASLLYDPPVELEPEPTPEERRAAADEEVREAIDWTAADKEVLGQLEERLAQFNSDASVYMNARQAAEKMKADGQAVPLDVQQKLAEEAQRLAAEKLSLVDDGQKVRNAAELKTAEAARRRLYRDIPELKDAATRKAFIDWAVSEGYQRERIMAERNPDRIGPAFKKFDAERRQAAAEKRERKRVANLPHRTRIHEIRGEYDLGTMFYGTAAEKAAHRRAVERRRGE